MWDAHNAVNDKLEPIIIFVCPPQGPQWACLTWELRRARGGKWVYGDLYALVGERECIESNAAGKKSQAASAPVTIKIS